MDIKICGPGCAKCDEAYKLVVDHVEKAGISASIKKITDFQEIAQMGIFSTPAVVVDGEVKCVGQVPKEKDLFLWLKQ